jgi:hypothetical protein
LALLFVCAAAIICHAPHCNSRAGLFAIRRAVRRQPAIPPGRIAARRNWLCGWKSAGAPLSLRQGATTAAPRDEETPMPAPPTPDRKIEIAPGLVQIDAEIVAKALGLTPEDLRQQMRDGTVTSRFEQGEGEDAGRVRLTFQSATRRARFTADSSGAILSATSIDAARPPGSGPQG